MRTLRDSTGTPLLRSKLAVPGRPDGLVRRPRLHRMLDAAVEGAVTLLVAPPGWGKTVLLSSWVAQAAPARVGWLTLERGDEGDRFWSYLLAALRGGGPAGYDGPGTVPAAGAAPDGTFLVQLAAALARLPEPVVCVLDDFQEVRDARVLRGLEFLLRHAGAQLRLVIATRVEPDVALHRWRLTGDVTELRTGELSFATAEAAELLANQGLVLPDGRLRDLQTRAEGWPAGLQLAALSMRAHPDPARFVDQFTGHHPGIADYLTREGYADQPADVRELLLDLAVVERVCGGLADALTGRADGERVLAELARANGFVVAVPGRRPWYRYRHLFADLLRAQLRQRAPERIPELHRRAAGWHAANGQPVDALRHALAARDWAEATRLLADHWYEVLLCGHRAPSESWGLPPPVEESRVDPELALAYAAVRLDLGDLDGAGTYLRHAARQQHRVADGRRARFAVMTAAFRLAEARLRGDTEQVRSFAPRMLALAAAGSGERWNECARAVALCTLGAAHLGAGEVDAALHALGGGLAAAQRTGLACAQLVCTSQLAFVRAIRGRLRSAHRTAEAALGMPSCDGRCHLVREAYAYATLAFVHHQWDRVDDAERYLRLAANPCAFTGEPALLAGTAILRAWLLRARGDLAGAYEALAAGRRAGDQEPADFFAHWFLAAEADLRTCYGDTATARRLLTPALAKAHGAAGPLAVSLARAYLHDDDPVAAAQALRGWSADPTATPLLWLRLDAGLLDAVAARVAGDERRAFRTLERVLELAEPEGFRRVFVQGGPAVRGLLVDHLDGGTAYWPLVRQLTDVTAGPPAGADRRPAAPAAPLTDREQTVLRYLESTRSNDEIATDMSVSVNTIKTHVRHIYRKLEVASRREAVRRARRLRLL